MKHPFITAAGSAAVFLLFSSSFANAMQLAQVEVIESSPTIRAIGQPRNSNASRSVEPAQSTAVDSSIQGELYSQLQVLQEEVQMLRGLVEEQSYQLQQLKQQRIDDYTDLDRRLSQLMQSGAGGRSPASSSATGAGQSAASSSQRTAGEFESYSAAVDLATRQQEFDKAILALKEHLNNYPDGRYAGNAHYWLGQIYFVQGNLDEAKESFDRVIRNYPDHNKAAESRYKLGQVYFRQGDRARARSLLQEVASGNSESAPLARNFLQQNFPN